MAAPVCAVNRPPARRVDERIVLCHFAEESLAVSARAEGAVP
jgi:hypothetical protein